MDIETYREKMDELAARIGDGKYRTLLDEDREKWMLRITDHMPNPERVNNRTISVVIPGPNGDGYSRGNAGVMSAGNSYTVRCDAGEMSVDEIIDAINEELEFHGIAKIRETYNSRQLLAESN